MQPLFFILSPFLITSAAAYMLPSPPGQYNVTLSTGPLTDTSRNNTALMISVFQPAKCASTVAVPSMPEKTAKYQAVWAETSFNVTGNFSSLALEARLPVCPSNCSTTTVIKDAPILLLSHGLGGNRLYHNVIASALASEGFTIITIDHPSDANIVEYPDGHTLIHNITSLTPEEAANYVNIRAADASFVVDQLGNATAMAASLGLAPFPTDRIAMLGHSIGGATAIHVAGQDPRIRAAINWDGALWNPLPATGISQPVSMVASDRPVDASWETAWLQFHGPKLWTKIADLKHAGLIEVKTMLKAAGRDFNILPDVFGTLDPDVLREIVVAYTTEWMKGAFAGKVGGALLEGEEPERFPAVSIVEKGNY